MKQISPQLVDICIAIMRKSANSIFTWDYIHDRIAELERLQDIPDPAAEQKEAVKVPEPKAPKPKDLN